MSETGSWIDRDVSIGDAAVTGLISGLAAGLIMATFLILVGFVSGEEPTAVLGYFAPDGSYSPWTGTLVHLAVSGIYGIIFGITYRWLRGRWEALEKTLLIGVVGGFYGLLLWLIGQYVILPGTGVPLQLVSPFIFLLAHLVFGLSLGILIKRSDPA